MSAKGDNSGNLVGIIYCDFCCEMVLDMLQISSETNEHEGISPFFSGVDMNFSTSRRIVLVPKSTLPLMPRV